MLMGTIAVLSAIFSVLICFGANGFGTLAWLWILPVSFVGLFLGLAILAFLALWGLTAIVDMNKPQDTDSKFYRWLTYLYIDAVFVILQTRFHTTGLENVPKDGRFLLVCNHLNDLDPLSLLKHFKKSQLAFISKRENDEKFIVGKLMHKILCQPINRENDREALKTIVKCIQILKEDKASIAVFPEGYTSRDGKLHFPQRRVQNCPEGQCAHRGLHHSEFPICFPQRQAFEAHGRVPASSHGDSRRGGPKFQHRGAGRAHPRHDGRRSGRIISEKP